MCEGLEDTTALKARVGVCPGTLVSGTCLQLGYFLSSFEQGSQCCQPLAILPQVSQYLVFYFKPLLLETSDGVKSSAFMEKKNS